jgi:putative transposase
MKQVVMLKLHPSPEQENALRETMRACNAAASFVAQVGFEKQIANKLRLQKETYFEVREQFRLPSQLAVLSIRKAADALTRDKKKQHVFRPTGAITYDVRCLTYKGLDRVSLLTLNGRTAMPFVCGAYGEQKLPRIRGQADLVARDGMWFLYATVDVPEPPQKTPQDFLGVDMGVTNIAVDSDGQVHSARTLNSVRVRYARLRRKLQDRGTKSARRLLRKRRRKERRFATDTNHCISKKLVKKAKGTARGIAVEELTGIRERCTVKKAQRLLHHSWAFSQLRAFLTYKAQMAGVALVAVDPRNTSRTCTSCGCIDKRNRKSQAVFRCISCGFVAHADTLAAQNIAVLGRALVNAPDVANLTV